MEPFRTHTGKLAVLGEDNIDTDRIIPARFLSRVSRFGYGELLFQDVRGPEFPLDLPEALGATILVTGINFGCGSSREHAVWAIQQAGFKAVIARRTADSPGYSDIFRQNAANCGMLLIELDETDHALLVEAGSGSEATLDLEARTIQLGDRTLRFDINEGIRSALLQGLDLIGTTLRHADEIENFEKGHPVYVPSRPSERLSN